MALLSKEQITAADDRQWEDVDVPEWGGTVRLLGMSGTERNAYQSSLVVIGPNGSVQRMNMADQLAKLVGKCLVGEDFQRLFTDKEIKALGAKAGTSVQVVGFDGTPDGLKAVEAGTLYASVAQQPKELGRIAVDNALRAVDGKKVSGTVKVPVKVVTKDNGAGFGG